MLPVAASKADLGRISKDISAILRGQNDIKNEVNVLLAGQRELMRTLGQQSMCAANSTGATVASSEGYMRGKSITALSEFKDVSLPQIKEEEGHASEEKSQQSAPAKQVTISTPSDASLGAARSTSIDRVVLPLLQHSTTSWSEDGQNSDGIHGPITHPSGNLGNIAVSLSPHWPSNVQRQQEYAIAEDLVLEAFSPRQPGAWKDLKSSPDRLEKNFALQTPAKRKWRTLHPGGNARITMDMLGLITLFFDLWIVPFALAWDLNPRWMRACSFVSIAYWSVDIILNFVTGYHRYGEVEMKFKAIAGHYLRTMFVPDCTILGTDLMATVADFREGRLLRAVKVGKLIRMLRLARLLSAVERLESATTYRLPVEIQAFLQITELLVCILWVNHLLCCGWWALGTEASSDTGMHWIDTDLQLGSTQTYMDASLVYQYTTSLHWAIVQMTPGSMQVQPLNSAERLYNVLCLIFGILFFSSLISSLSSVTTHMRLLKSEQVMKVKSLRKFLNQRRIDRRTQLSILKQVTQRYRSQRPLVLKDVPALEQLSDTLRRELRFEMIVPHVVKHGFLRLVVVINSHTAVSLCSEAMDFIVKSSSDTLFLPDYPSNGALLVSHGSLEYRQSPDTSRADEETITPVEAGECLAEAGLWVHWKHVGQCDCKTVCEVISVDTKRLCQVVQTHHALRHIAWEYCRTFHARLVSAFPPNAVWPTDLHVPFTTFKEMMLASSAEVRILIGRLSIEMLCSKFLWHWRIPAQEFEQLCKDVDSGSCVLVPAESDPLQRVERVMAATALEIIKGNLVLVTLGSLTTLESGKSPSFRDGVWQCKLPGIRQMAGEPPAAALTRLISSRFAAVGQDLRITGPRQDEVLEEGLLFGRMKIGTRYLRTIYTADIEGLVAELGLFASDDGMDQHKPFIVKSEKDSEGDLYAWVDLEQACHLQSVPNSPELKAIVSAALSELSSLDTVSLMKV
mmetsp:Transcript_12318/g.28870  ORF Transcript_12318/g.28870 Transcript_12318/m.28870 type:complete len:966 (-) Transcript_12318:35-2932(-)